jgi:arylsulfatase A-like enzyme
MATAFGRGRTSRQRMNLDVFAVTFEVSPRRSKPQELAGRPEHEFVLKLTHHFIRGWCEAGIEKETLVIFTSDNGGQIAARNLPLSGRKQQLLEGGIRVPFVVWQPGTIAPGQVVEQPVITMDVTATALAVAGAKVPEGQPLDGIDLMPLVTGKSSPEPRTLFWRSRKINHRAKTNEIDARAVRDGDWKLYWSGQKPKLFNLKEDVGETRDLSAERPDVVEKLVAKIEAWEKQVSPPKELYAR